MKAPNKTGLPPGAGVIALRPWLQATANMKGRRAGVVTEETH